MSYNAYKKHHHPQGGKGPSALLPKRVWRSKRAAREEALTCLQHRGQMQGPSSWAVAQAWRMGRMAKLCPNPCSVPRVPSQMLSRTGDGPGDRRQASWEGANNLLYHVCSDGKSRLAEG